MDSGPLGEPRSWRRRRKGERSGFGTFLRVLGVLFVVALVTCAGAAYLAMRNPAVREIVDAAMQSTHAPGSAELRAAGCAQAVVMDLAGARDALAGARTGGEAGEELPLVLVSCQLRSAENTLRCDDVARVYVNAVGEDARRFVAQVSVGISGRPQCQVVYTETGRRVGALEELTRER